jgi:phage anti-repressor protein
MEAGQPPTDKFQQAYDQDLLCAESHFTRKDYHLVGFGTLRTVSVDGEGWVSVEDVAKLAGILTIEVTGPLSLDEEPTKGCPGYLDPDGILELQAKFGIADIGIRIAACLPIFMQARGGRQLVEFLMLEVIPDLLGDQTAGGGMPGLPASAVVNPDLTMAGRSGDCLPSKVRQWVFFDPELGECRGVLLGTTIWVLLSNISSKLRLSRANIISLAGRERIIVIPNASIQNAMSPDGDASYLRFDSAVKLLRSSPYSEFLAEMLEQWVRDNLLSPASLIAAGAVVQASSLHQIFSPNTDFSVWLDEFGHKNTGLIDLMDDYWIGDSDDVNGFPLTLASEAALKERTFIGTVVYRLLSESGYLHNGNLGEPADETLARFRGLIPDRWGRVDARLLHEFLQITEPFNEWLQILTRRGDYRGRDGNAPPANPGEFYLSVSEAYSRISWDMPRRTLD